MFWLYEHSIMAYIEPAQTRLHGDRLIGKLASGATIFKMLIYNTSW